METEIFPCYFLKDSIPQPFPIINKYISFHSQIYFQTQVINPINLLLGIFLLLLVNCIPSNVSKLGLSKVQPDHSSQNSEHDTIHAAIHSTRSFSCFWLGHSLQLGGSRTLLVLQILSTSSQGMQSPFTILIS